MDIHQLDYFIAAVQAGNFKKAADGLFVSRQALSKAVHNLENELGESLFDISDGTFKPTPLGLRLYQDAKPVVASFKQIETRYTAPSRQRTSTRTLSMALSHESALSLPNRTIDAFCETRPDILLSVEETSTETALDLVRTGDIDLALVGSTPRYLEEFESLLVVRTGIFLYIPEKDPFSKRMELSLEDLEGKPLITFGKRNHLHRFFLEVCADADVQPHIVMTTSDLDLLLRSAESQGAYYFGFPPFICDAQKVGRVGVRVDTKCDEVFGTFAIRRKESPHNEASRELWHLLEKLARKNRDLERSRYPVV